MSTDLKIQGIDESIVWFLYPEYNQQRNMVEPKCLDSHHLLVNYRVKACNNGFAGYGISKEAWQRVAESDNSIISKAIVTDLIDK